MAHALVVVIFIDIFSIISKAGFINNDTNGEAEEIIEFAHPAGVALCEVIVYRDNVDTTTGKSIEVNRQGCHEGFTFTSLHFGNVTFVKDNTTDELYVKWTELQNTVGRFAHERESLWQNLVECAVGLGDFCLFVLFLGLFGCLFVLFIGILGTFNLGKGKLSLILLLDLLQAIFELFGLLLELLVAHLGVFRAEFVNFGNAFF